MSDHSPAGAEGLVAGLQRLRAELESIHEMVLQELENPQWRGSDSNLYQVEANLRALLADCPLAESPGVGREGLREHILKMRCVNGADLEHLPFPSPCLSERCDKCSLLRLLATPAAPFPTNRKSADQVEREKPVSELLGSNLQREMTAKRGKKYHLAGAPAASAPKPDPLDNGDELSQLAQDIDANGLMGAPAASAKGEPPWVCTCDPSVAVHMGAWQHTEACKRNSRALAGVGELPLMPACAECFSTRVVHRQDCSLYDLDDVRIERHLLVGAGEPAVAPGRNGATIEEAERWLTAQIDWHDVQDAMADAADYVDASKYHERQRKALSAARAALRAAASPAPAENK